MNAQEQFWDLVSRGYKDQKVLRSSIAGYFEFSSSLFRNTLQSCIHEESRAVELLVRLSEAGVFSPDEALIILASLAEEDVKNVFPSDIEAAADQVILQGGSVSDYHTVRNLANSRGPLTTYWSAIAAGSLYPIMPETRERDLELLELAKMKDIFGEYELQEALDRMHDEWATVEVREKWETRYLKSRMPFARENTHLTDYGFHAFLGRDVVEGVRECLCAYDCTRLLGFAGLETALRELSSRALNGQRVLLSKDAGMLELNGDNGRFLRSFKPEQMETLRGMFESRHYSKLLSIKGLDNPFSYQP